MQITKLKAFRSFGYHLAWSAGNLHKLFEDFLFEIPCVFGVIDIQKRRGNVRSIESADAVLILSSLQWQLGHLPVSTLDAIPKALTGLSIQQSCW